MCSSTAHHSTRSPMSRAYPWCSLFERLTHTEEGFGRGRLRGVGADGYPGGAAGHRARLRRRAGRGPRDRVAEFFAPGLSGSLLLYVGGNIRKFVDMVETVNDNDTNGGSREQAPVPALHLTGAIGLGLLLLGTVGRTLRCVRHLVSPGVGTTTITFVAGLMLAVVVPAGAQPLTSRVEGTVRDETGAVIQDASVTMTQVDTDIEHIVALAEAYDSGIAESDYRTFGGDIDNLTVAVPNVSRIDKSDSDAAEWRPDRNLGWYAATTVLVKQKYSLSVNPAERDALAMMLRKDPGREVDCSTVVPALPFLDHLIDRAIDVLR